MSDGFWLAVALIVIACMWFNVSIAETFWTIIGFWWAPVTVFCVSLAILFVVIIIGAIFSALAN